MLCIWVFCLHICLCIVCMWCPQRPEEGIRFPGTQVRDDQKPQCGSWELNSCPLQEQPVLLTVNHPSLQPLVYIFFKVLYILLLNKPVGSCGTDKSNSNPNLNQISRGKNAQCHLVRLLETMIQHKPSVMTLCASPCRLSLVLLQCLGIVLVLLPVFIQIHWGNRTILLLFLDQELLDSESLVRKQIRPMVHDDGGRKAL